MKKALLSLLMAIVCLPVVFGQAKVAHEIKYDNISSCTDITWRDNHTYTRDTVVYRTTTDTIFVLNFTKLPSYVDTVAVAATVMGECTATWNGKNWPSAGFHYDTLQAINTCDSVVKVKVVLASVMTNIIDTVCGSYTAPWGDTYNTSRTIIDTNITHGECEYTTSLRLVVNPEYKDLTRTIDDAGCYFLWKNDTIRNFDPFVDSLYTVAGHCDSITTITVTAFSGIQHDSLFVSACDSYTPSWIGATAITESTVTSNDTIYGTYLTAESTPAPCTHRRILTLKIDNTNTDTMQAPLVQLEAGCFYIWNEEDTIRDNEIHYSLMKTAHAGCDSLAALQITSFSNKEFDTVYTKYCGLEYRWKTKDTLITFTNNYTDGINHNIVKTYEKIDTNTQCTYSHTLDLKFVTVRDTLNTKACDHYDYIFQARSQYNAAGTAVSNRKDTAHYNVSGIYLVDENEDTLYSMTNFYNYFEPGTSNRYIDYCKTYHTLNLTVKDLSYGQDELVTVTKCDQYKFHYGKGGLKTKNFTESFSGVLIDSSFVYSKCYRYESPINLTINKKSYANYNETKCDSYTWPFNNKTYTSSTSAEVKLDEPNAKGCDSIGRLHLTINYTPAVYIDGDLTVAPGESAKLYPVTEGSISTYKWYIGTSNTPYATTDTLVLSNVESNTDIRLEAKSTDNCTAESWATIAAFVGIDNVDGIHANIYPNPTSRFLNIETAEAMSDVVLYNALGQKVISRKADGNRMQIDLGNMAVGTYTLTINGTDGAQTIRKIIVNK